MKHVDLYGRVRHAVLIDGMSRREAARIFGINRRTVEKMLTFSIPPGYRRDKEIRRPKLGGFTVTVGMSTLGAILALFDPISKDLLLDAGELDLYGEIF